MKLLLENLPPSLANQRETLARRLEAMDRVLPLTAVYLFGSHARGEARPDSDVDLCLVAEGAIEQLKAAQRFFDIYWRLIYGVALRAGLTDAEAQDVVQETVISVAKHLPGFRYDPKVCSFKTWKGVRWGLRAPLRVVRGILSLNLSPLRREREFVCCSMAS